MAEVAEPTPKKPRVDPVSDEDELLAAGRARVAEALSLPPTELAARLTNVQPPAPAPGPGLAPFIDHTLLRADATKEQITTLCSEAQHHGFASVCVNACWVPLCVELLKGCDVRVCTVVGFPLGATTSETKAYEAQGAVSAGAQEVDMVLNVGWLRGGQLKAVYDDVKAVVEAVPPSVVVKVILEVCLLTRPQIVEACLLCVLAGATFVKTSTGFSTGGATPESVSLMKVAVAGSGLRLKAAGGVKTAADAQRYMELGVTRIGTSSGVALLGGGTAAGY